MSGKVRAGLDGVPALQRRGRSLFPGPDKVDSEATQLTLK